MKARGLVGIVAVLALAAWFGWRGLRSPPIETASEPATLAPAETLRAAVELAEPTAPAERASERTVEAATRSEVKVEASITLQPADARLLVAVVAAENGRALAGIRVSLRPEPHGPHRWKHLTTSVGDETHPPLTDAEGKATLHVRADVAFTLTAERLTEPLAKVEVPVEALAKDELRDVRVELATVTDVLYYGRAIEANTRAPIAGAVATSRVGPKSAGESPSVRSAADGIFAWPAHSSVPANVRVEAPEYGPRFAFLDARYATPEHALDVELTRGAALVVRVVGERPSELALRVRVTAELSDLLQVDPAPDGRVFRSERGGERWEADVDREGRATFALLPARVALAVAVRSEQKELARHGKSLRLEPGATRELEIELGPGATIVGTLRDQTGAPVAASMVFLSAADDPSSRSRAPRSVSTDELGAFEFDAVPIGRWLVGITSRDRGGASNDASGLFGRSESVEIAASDRRVVVDLVATRGLTLAGLVVDDAGQPVAGMRVLALDAEPNAQFDEDSLRKTESRADGTFVLPRVSDGEWRVWADASAGFAASEQVLAKGGDTGVRLVVARGLSVVVTVLDEAGVHVTRGSLTISESVPEPSTFMSNAFANGECTLAGLRPGRFDLTAITPEGGIGSACAEFVAPGASAEAQHVTLTVRPGGTLELSVIGAVTAFDVRHGGVRVAFDNVLPGNAARVLVPTGVSTVEWTAPRTRETRTKDVRVAAGEKVVLRLDEE